MAKSVIPYKQGTMELSGTVFQKWGGGNINIETAKTDIKVVLVPQCNFKARCVAPSWD